MRMITVLFWHRDHGRLRVVVAIPPEWGTLAMTTALIFVALRRDWNLGFDKPLPAGIVCQGGWEK